MSVLNLHKIKKSYGITEVLKDFSLFVNAGERVGLIGPNGSGKTTVFKIIAGMEKYDAGTLALKKGIELGYLEQMPNFAPHRTLYEELRSIFQPLIELEQEIRLLEKTMQGVTGPKLEDLLAQYSELQHRFEINGGYQFESKIRQIAMGMGFSWEELQQKRVAALSGGEKTRLGLVKLLLSEPDLLLLDEPTNHLDISSLQWLENYLQEYSGAVVIISHDRYFLDKVVTRIVEIKNGSDEVYHGNYSYYLKERKLRYERQLKAYENQQKKIKEMEEAIKRLRQWGQQGDNVKFFKRAQSMQKSLDRMERIEKPILDGKQMGLNLEVKQRSGNEVLKIEGLAKSFGERQLFSNLHLDLYYGDKGAIIGKNGTGKTTLIKMITRELSPDRGEIKIGANVQIGYYSQEFEGFNPEDDLITALKREVSLSTQEARDSLAAFLFTEDEVFKKVKDLSGGEKSRLRLLQLMHGDYNFLLLDEPTNHLDLPSREVLEEVLLNYPGTILVISHDRYFLNKLVDYIYELEDGVLTKYYGNYDYYREKKAELELAKNSLMNNAAEAGEQKSEYHLLKEKVKAERKRKNKLKEIEREIEDKERRVGQLEQEMTAPENINDYNLLNQLKEEYDWLQKELKQLYQEWEQII